MKLLNRRTLAAVGLALWSLACSDTPNPAALPESSTTDLRIANLADTATVQVGQTRQLTAKILSYSGSTINGTITWSSSANSIATVSSTGLVKGIAAGQAVITASYYWSKARTTVTVVAAGTAPKPLVATVAVAAPSASVAVGATVQATATARDSTNTIVAGSTFTWASSNATVATVSATGLITGVAQGSATISATTSGKAGTLAFTVTAVTTTPPQPPAPAGGSPDPTFLPTATISMPMNTTGYSALNVRTMAAGGSYRDPVSNARVTKLTSASFPVSGGPSWSHDYFEGGSEVSNPYTGDGVTRAVKVYDGNGSHYLLDVIPGSGVSRSRALSGNLSPAHDLSFTFSINPTTPYYAYVVNGGALKRFDLRTMAEAPGNGFPMTSAGDGLWLQVCANDAEFVWMAGSTMHHFTPATNRHVTLSDGNANEPRFSRGCRYVGLSMNNPDNGLRMWDTQTNTVTWSQGSGIWFAHQAVLQDMWIMGNPNSSYPYSFMSVTSTPNSYRTEWGPAVGDNVVGSGQWMQSGDQRNAWTVWNSYGNLNGEGTIHRNWLAQGGIVLVTMNGGAAGARLLAHPYSNQGDYYDYAWPKFSADGKVVLFTSDMLGSGRHDQFLVELPLR